MSIRFGNYLAKMIDNESPPEWTLHPAPPLFPPVEPLRYIGVNAAFNLIDFGLVKI